jgi:DNA-binding response OmpR family regulator
MARILIVDDDVNMVKLTETILSANGHDAIGTTQPHEAFESVRKDSFDLIILDIVMPEFGGVDFLNALKILSGFKTPVLMLSGQGSIEAVKESLQLGAVDYLVKPFEASLLLARVSAALKKKARSPART